MLLIESKNNRFLVSSKDHYIEFLRAISVIAVIVYHLYPNFFPNGYLGVDVFFVISGYIITKTLSRTKQDIKAVPYFYKKRVLRLLPGLYLMLLVVALFSLFIDPPHSSKNIGQGILASVLYFANIFYYTEIDYFNDFHTGSPIVHTWSLSLEEQFYLFFPVLFVLIKNNKSKIFLFSFIALCSLLFYSLSSDELYKHYMPNVRIWELIFGVIVALIPGYKVNNFVSKILIFFILLYLFTNAEIIAKNIEVVTLVGLSIFMRPKVEILFFKYFLTLGSLSYSLYLWHQPLIYYGRILEWNISIIIFATIVVSFLGFKYFETPLRYSLPNKVIPALVFSTILLVAIGYSAHSSRGWFDIKLKLFNISNVGVNWDYDNLLSERSEIREEILALNCQDSSIYVIGDSKAEDLIISLFKEYNVRFNWELIDAPDYNYNDFDTNVSISKSIDRAEVIVFTNTWERDAIPEIKLILTELDKLENKRILVLSTSNFEDVSSMYFDYLKNHKVSFDGSTIFKSYLRSDWQRQSDELKMSLMSLHHVEWINKEDAFLDSDDGFIQNNELLIYDTGHLSKSGFSYFGSWMSSQIGIHYVK